MQVVGGEVVRLGESVVPPGDDDVVCFEPMAAPTDALRRGGYREVEPGESVSAVFRIVVS